MYANVVQAFAEKMEQLNLHAQQAEALATTCIAPLTVATTEPGPDTSTDQGNAVNIDIFVQDVSIMPEVDVDPYVCCAEVTRAFDICRL